MNRSLDRSTLICGIGSALVDILLQESDEFLASCGAKKGGMTLVDGAKIDLVLSQSARSPRIVPGGSACNTVIGVGRLGGNARFIGKRGNDPLGALFEDSLRRQNVEPALTTSPSPTGRVLSIITPDAQRSMFTFLGASSEALAEEISPERFAGAAVAHIEGYLLFNDSLMRAALENAKAAGAKISLDLASYTVVEQHKKTLEEIIPHYIDILIANEDEARVFTGCNDESMALQALAAYAPTAVLKAGKRGSYIAHKSRVTQTGIMGDGRAVDTTGAGDLWAAGFLYGVAHGYSIEQCGSIGAACGYEVCQVIGAEIPSEGWKRIRRHVMELGAPRAA
jgi:sugar/nucleoside kinase (ribokinase family)